MSGDSFSGDRVETLSESIRIKSEAKYDPSLDQSLRQWVSQVLGEPIDPSPNVSFASIFKDGVLLCRLINTLRPGTVRTIHTSRLAFKQMENIQHYLEGCAELGLTKANLFDTIDLFEEKDINNVLMNLHNLSQTPAAKLLSSSGQSSKTPPLKAAHSHRGGSPYSSPPCSPYNSARAPSPNSAAPPATQPLAFQTAQPPPQSQPKPPQHQRTTWSPIATTTIHKDDVELASSPQERTSPPHALRSQASVSTTIPRGRGRATESGPAFRGCGTRGTASVARGDTSGRGAGRGGVAAATGEGGRRGGRGGGAPAVPARGATSIARGSASRSTALKIGAGRVRARAIIEAQNPLATNSASSSSPAEAAGSPRATGSSWRSSTLQKTSSQPDVSSLTDDVNAKQAFKYNPILEEQAIRWIEACLGEASRPTATLHEVLKDGVWLCRLINKIKPGFIPENSIHTSAIPYKQMENIGSYLRACKALGIAETDLFNTPDLFEAKNVNLVINNIHVLAKHVEIKGLAPNLPPIEDSSKARRAYSLFFTEVAGLKDVQAALAQLELEEQSKEEQELINWMNSHLFPNGPTHEEEPIVSIKLNLSDGVHIIRLLELLTEQGVGFYEQNPKQPWHKMQNATLILRFIAEQTFFTVRGCTTHDIVLGNVQSIIVLLKYIREKFDHEYQFRGMKEDTRRMKIAEEVLTTERTYVQSLNAVIEWIVKPLREALTASAPILTETEIEEVFANIEDIVTFHSSLLNILEERMRNFGPDTLLGDVFVEKFDSYFVEMNKRYVRDFDNTHLVIPFLKNEKPQFEALIETFEKEQKKTSGLPLNSFLILPVQRVPRYMLLIQELAKHTPADHPDMPHVEHAKEKLGFILDDINRSKSKSDNVEKLGRIEAMIIGLDELPMETLAHPKRRYIKEGPLIWEGETEEGQDAYFFLFNDFLMYTRHRSEEELEEQEPDKEFEYITLLPLNFIEDIRPCQDNAQAFEAVLEEDVATFIAPSSQDRDAWLKDLRHCVQSKVVIQFFS